MKIIRTSHIPFGKFSAMAFYGFCFIKKGFIASEYTINEEKIHSEQQIEVAVLTFILIAPSVISGLISWWWILLVPTMYFILYGLFWVIEAVLPPYNTAYQDTCFEREAKLNRSNLTYTLTRDLCSWVKYFK